MTETDMANANASIPKAHPVRRAVRQGWHWLYMALWFNARRRLVRWLLRRGLLPASTKADTDTMGEWKRLMAEKDDPKPGLVLPDPNAAHAALIRRVRLYAQNGAKALAPLLDRGLPYTVDDEEDFPTDVEAFVAWKGRARPLMMERCIEYLQVADANAATTRDFDGMRLTNELMTLSPDKLVEALTAIHAAYNSPWTVIDGEVYEYESERKRRVVQ